MEIKGKVHLFFEQSGTFKNEFIKLGIPAEDYDIQDNFGQTDHVIDLFHEIETAYDGGISVFDSITKNDLIVAFFPCIYFCCLSQMDMSWTAKNYRKLTYKQRTEKILERADNRHKFYTLCVKMLTIAKERDLRLVMENPWGMQTYLKSAFVCPPTIVDNNRMLRWDFVIKPTAYWFINCEPTQGFTHQNDKKRLGVINGDLRQSDVAGVCSEERSTISPDYARNFICDNILGKEQEYVGKQLSLF